ncbi:hypothetical protein BD779DRAFT_1682526 [Infundibulicybe gibba]|nr:hypothetical protein BD779DRAFT_1682526 [Infundibulicybe gibba]
MSKKIIIIGGHGKVGTRLARLLSGTHSVTSVIRNAAQEDDIKNPNTTSLQLDLETSTVKEFSTAFAGFDVVVFAAGAKYNDPEEAFQKIDLGGSLKVFDATEAMADPKPRLVVLSAVDVRDLTKAPPAHYSKADIEESGKIHQWVGNYMKYKFEADKNLVKRSFKWTMLRSGGMTDDTGTDDVAQALALLIERDDANHLAIDFVGGDVPIKQALDAAIKRGETDFAE